MKQSTIFGISSFFIFVGSTAHAQSSVTLYGILDAGIAYVHNAQASNGTNSSTLFKFGSGNRQGNRWGLKGQEDMGGGLTAIFQLENGFNIGNGTLSQGGREFGRQAYVGMASKTWGSMTLGRQYDPLVDMVQPLTADRLLGGTFATPGDLDNFDNSARVNNSIKYISPSFGSLQFEALYAFGGVAGAAGNSQTYSFGASFAQGPFSAAAGYFFANGGNSTTAGVRTWNGSTDTLFNTVINQGFASANSMQIARAAAQYVLGSATVGVSYSNTQYGHDGFSTFHQTAKFNSGAVFFDYQISPFMHTGVGYNYTSLTGPSSAHYNQANIALEYYLSKRTNLYALASYQRASGMTLNGKGVPVSASASIGSYGINSGSDSQVLATIGIRHKF